MFWTRVDIEDATTEQTGTGNVRPVSWAPVESDVEARLLPLTVTEERTVWATPEEDAYEVQLRGSWLGFRPRMRVSAEGEVYDIRRIIVPPPFGTPVTTLLCVKVTP